jgi:hypothetical protein
VKSSKKLSKAENAAAPPAIKRLKRKASLKKDDDDSEDDDDEYVDDDEEEYDINGNRLYDDDDEIDWTVTSISAEKRRRIAILYQYMDVYNCPPIEQWDGKEGFVKKISDNLGILPAGRKNAKKTLRDIHCCVATKEV